MSSVSLKKVAKSFGRVDVIHDVDIEIEGGEFCVFVGPSGCGKSTLLRMIAGLDETTGGDIEIGGRRVNGLEPAQREVAMVFQSYALYPHMNVEQNMGFGLRMNGMPREEVSQRVGVAARILRLENLLHRKPRQLSGGQRQRVAIGRAIVRNPKVFLFDEPLSNLDAELRVATRLELARLHRQLAGPTMIYVTHDQVEAMTLADKIVVLHDGRVEQIGSPMKVYLEPANLFVAGFIGSPRMNLIPLKAAASGETQLPDGTALAVSGSDLSGAHHLGVRADQLVVAAEGEGHFRGEVQVVEALGEADFVYMRSDWGQDLVARCPMGSGFAPGQVVSMRVAGRHHLFDADGQALRHVS